MFGYVRPVMDDLAGEERDLFSAHYCGLCSVMGRQSRMALAYDCAFLAFVIRQGKSTTEKCIRCKGNLLRKKWVIEDEGIRYCGDVNTILAYYKALDDKADEKGIRGRFLVRFFRKDYQEAKRRRPDLEAHIGSCIGELSRLEAEKCPQSDRMADTMAQLMQSLVKNRGENLERLFYHLGRWIYLVDAMTDYDKDEKRGQYNVLRYEWKNREEAEEAMDFALWHSLSVVEAEAKEIEMTESGRLVMENVINKALPARTILALPARRSEIGSV